MNLGGSQTPQPQPQPPLWVAFHQIAIKSEDLEEVDGILRAFTSIQETFVHLENVISDFRAGTDQLAQRCKDLEADMATKDEEIRKLKKKLAAGAATPAVASHGPKATAPDAYKGERGPAARAFLQGVGLYSALRPHDFPTELVKIRWVLSRMTDKAAVWAQPYIKDALGPYPSLRMSNWSLFEEEFKKAFFDPNELSTAACKLNALRQTSAATNYTTEWRSLIAILGWTEEAQLKQSFYKGLKAEVKDDLARMDEPKGLEDLIALAQRVDDRRCT